MKIITSFFILLIPLLGNAIDFKIGILRNASLKKISVTVNKANYSLKSADNSLTEIIGPDNLITVNYRSGKISLSIDSKYIGIYDTLNLVNLEKDTGFFEIKSISPDLKSRYYYDDLIIYPQSNSITIVNKIDFEKYIIGVLESEVGLGKSEDFYKVHAIISRTYALKNQYKFIHEGFYLTDLVNCQVYKGNMYKDLTIIDAVKATESLILVDENMDFITASYFSNSGGQTNNVEDVWTKSLPYLRSIHDPYSLG